MSEQASEYSGWPCLRLLQRRRAKRVAELVHSNSCAPVSARLPARLPADAAKQFDLRMQAAAQPWCCQVGGGGDMSSEMQRWSMTAGRLYSEEPGLPQACPP